MGDNYTPQTWIDGSGGGTPVSATRLQHIEDGIVAVDDAASGASGWDSTTLTVAEADWTSDGSGTWKHPDSLVAPTAAGVISQTNPTATSWLLWDTQLVLPPENYIVDGEFKINTGQDAGTYPEAAIVAGEDGDDFGEYGVGVGAISLVDPGDAGPFGVAASISGGLLGAGASGLTTPINTWTACRVICGLNYQTLLIGGVFGGRFAGHPSLVDLLDAPGACLFGLKANGLISFRNLKIHTPTLPA